jgi:hypothetical protein
VLALAAVTAATLAACQSDPAAGGRFSGKYELVPLFDQGRPVIRNGHQYLALRNPISFRRPNGETVIMPAGMQTDLASIPRILWVALPPDGPWGEAALPHDLCYSSRGAMTWHGHAGRSRPQAYVRAECDQILAEAMLALGVPTAQREVIWLGVRIGGAAGWGS